MGRPRKSFDAIAFKEEMQGRAEEKLEGLPATERIRQIRQQAESGPVGSWWRSLRGTSVSKKPSPVS